MDSPYRIAEQKEDVVNTRLDSLEKAAETHGQWRKLCAAAMIVGLAGIAFISVVEVKARKGSCYSEVKTFSLADKDGSTNFACSHPDQKMRVSYTSNGHAIACVCHDEK
jgi:hypothetical protein